MIEELLLRLDGVGEIDATIAYADDLLLLVSASSRREMERKAHIAIQHLVDWCEGSKLQVSSEKSTYVLLKGNLRRDPVIRMGEQTLARRSVIKYPGVHIGERGSFAEHVKETCKKGTAVMQNWLRVSIGYG